MTTSPKPTKDEALKLLPCPFCGHDTPEFERIGTPGQSCIVECGMCGCRHESSDEGVRNGASWNTREALAQPDADDKVVAFVVPTSHVTQDGSMEDGPEYLEWADKASDYEKRIGTPLYTRHQPQAVQPAEQREQGHFSVELNELKKHLHDNKGNYVDHYSMMGDREGGFYSTDEFDLAKLLSEIDNFGELLRKRKSLQDIPAIFKEHAS